MTAARAPARPGRRTVVILGALSALAPLALDMYLPGLPALTRQLGAPAATGQLTLTACLLGLALGQLVVGPVSDAAGRRGPLAAGLALNVVATAGCALAPSIWTLIALRFVQGAAGGVGIVIARAVVRDLYGGAEAARVFAALMLVLGVAPVFAPLAGGAVLKVTSWRGVFWLLALIGVALLAATLAGLPESLPPGERHRGGLGSVARTFGALARDRRFVPHALCFSLAFAALFAYIAGSSFVLEDVYGASPQAYSVVFAVNSAALIGLSQLSGHLVGRVGPRRLLRAGLALAVVSGVATLAATLAHASLALLLACLVVLVGSNGLIVPNATALALADQRDRAGSASALLGLGQFGLAAAVAPLVGLGGSRTAIPMGIVIAACVVAAAAVEIR
jgi:DHA1 family bicyclomycin/chloramphenicol resistance-like MFS transporter